MNFFAKSLTIPKNLGRGTLSVSPGIVCYAEKEEKPFCFTSRGQLIQFGTIKFRRTSKNYLIVRSRGLKKKESL